MSQGTLPQGVLRRLERSFLRAEGANTAAQAAFVTARQAADLYVQQVRDACDDAGIATPPAGQPLRIHLDFNTGDLHFEPELAQVPNGVAA